LTPLYLSSIPIARYPFSSFQYRCDGEDWFAYYFVALPFGGTVYSSRDRMWRYVE
jgi:hypothetical protein